MNYIAFIGMFTDPSSYIKFIKIYLYLPNHTEIKTLIFGNVNYKLISNEKTAVYLRFCFAN